MQKKIIVETLNNQTSIEQTSILDDIQESYEMTTTGKRFANYLIDMFSFYAVFFIIGIILALVAPETLEIFEDESTSFKFAERIFSMLCYGLYMSLVEGLFKGKTLGKLITKTKAVNEDGTTISWSTAFKRGFSRIVPFEVFSGFSGYPWHDKWTKTYVVNEKKFIQ